MKKVDETILSDLFLQSKTSVRLRKNYNFHEADSDSLQRMLNALQKNSYCRPHKHITPLKREAFIILCGKLLVLEFDDEGNVTDYFVLNREEKNFVAEISAGKYHSVIALEDNTIAYEIKDGPYEVSTDKYFAPWAPEEGGVKGIEFNRIILEKLFNVKHL